ncbi:hypothetical protein ABU162_03870 [Paenibacillus thiaminolyticus]
MGNARTEVNGQDPFEFKLADNIELEELLLHLSSNKDEINEVKALNKD